MARTKTQGWQIESHTDQIEVTSNLPYPDENWRFIDTQGHEHTYAKDGSHYPTLTYVQDGIDYVDDGPGYVDEIPYGHYECATCGEHIKPGLTGPDSYRRFIPGHTSITVTSPTGKVTSLDGDQIQRLRQCTTMAEAEELLPSLVDEG